ncbi:serine hydrolase domain-containing protein [Actinopolymorpha sp. B17G11]|uniref:serine hydrolase domain-containing protein n=1 Tax=Actinopolymorpha sp. B17G11 TaxID=3160861 RepID=UPI0032E40A8F
MTSFGLPDPRKQVAPVMGQLTGMRRRLEKRFADLVAECQVPGAAVAVTAEGGMVEAAAGVLSRRTGVEVTPDSVFQIGLVAKVWTATLVMQLVDEGLVDLDVPVRTYVPNFRVADDDASETITLRHLLCHTAGFEGDYYPGTHGGAAETLQRYVESVLPNLPQYFAPGEMWSYSTAGFDVLSRVVEVLRNMPYADALRHHLVSPLGSGQFASCADEAILFRAAVGHVPTGPDGPAEPVTTWAQPCWPNGGLAMSAQTMLGIAQLQLRNGLAADGSRLLSADAAAEMTQPQVEQPRLGTSVSWHGLGWMVHEWEGREVLGHTGGTVGQHSFLRIVPDCDVAVALLTNGGDAGKLHNDLWTLVLADLTGLRPPPALVPPTKLELRNPERYIGCYQLFQRSVETVLADGAGKLWLVNAADDERAELAHVEGDLFAALNPSGQVTRAVMFLGADENHQAAYLHSGEAAPRVATAPG